MKSGSLIKYAWVGSSQLAMILGFRNWPNSLEIDPRWYGHPGGRMMQIILLGGGGLVPRMWNDDGTIWRLNHGNVAWTHLKNSLGMDLFEVVSL